MAEATRNAKIDEMMTLLKETTETQGRMLNELMQRVTMMDSRIEGLSSQPSVDRVETSTEHANHTHVGQEIERDQHLQTRGTRLNFPRFDGLDPNGWVYRAEQFFMYQRTPTTQKLLMASFHMEGKALQWFRWMERSRAISSWEEFTKSLLIRFGPSQYEDATGLLSKLKQTTTVEQYQTNFEELANRTESLNEPYMISCFISGLKDDIRLSVQMLKPVSLGDAIGLARMQEEKVANRRRQTQPDMIKNATSSNFVHQNSAPIVKKLSPVEMKERRDKGLCYNYDEKFAPRHRCKIQRLFLMEGNWLNDELKMTRSTESQQITHMMKKFPNIHLEDKV